MRRERRSPAMPLIAPRDRRWSGARGCRDDVLLWPGVALIGGSARSPGSCWTARSARAGSRLPVRHVRREPQRRRRARPPRRARPGRRRGAARRHRGGRLVHDFSTWMFETQRLDEERQLCRRVQRRRSSLGSASPAAAPAGGSGRTVSADSPEADRLLRRAEAHRRPARRRRAARPVRRLAVATSILLRGIEGFGTGTTCAGQPLDAVRGPARRGHRGRRPAAHRGRCSPRPPRLAPTGW